MRVQRTSGKDWRQLGFEPFSWTSWAFICALLFIGISLGNALASLSITLGTHCLINHALLTHLLYRSSFILPSHFISMGMNVHKIQLVARTSCALPATILTGPIDYISRMVGEQVETCMRRLYEESYSARRVMAERCVRMKLEEKGEIRCSLSDQHWHESPPTVLALLLRSTPGREVDAPLRPDAPRA